MRPCLRCGIPTSASYCRRCDPDRGRRRVTPGRTTKAQAKFRAAVLQAAGHRCQHIDEYGVRCEATTNLEAHHLIPLLESGSFDPRHGRALCSAHHHEAEQRLRDAAA